MLPTDVEKSGYTFAGWYDNEELTGSAATAISNTEYGDKTYYAKWTANTYSVKLHLNGGNLADGVSDITAYTYGQYILGKPANGIGDRAIYQPTP